MSDITKDKQNTKAVVKEDLSDRVNKLQEDEEGLVDEFGQLKAVVDKRSTQWTYLIYPSLVAFILLAAYGFWMVSNLTRDMHTIAENIASISQAIETSIGHNMDKVVVSMDNMDKNITNISSNITAIDQNFTEVSGYMKVMQKDVATLQSMLINMNELTKASQSMAYNMDNMQHQIGGMNYGMTPDGILNRFMPF